MKKLAGLSGCLVVFLFIGISEAAFSEHYEVGILRRLRRQRAISPSHPAPTNLAPTHPVPEPRLTAPPVRQVEPHAEKPDPSAVGIDLTIRLKGDNAASCQSTPIAKNEIEGSEGKCRIGILTAAHCLDESFQSIEFEGITKMRKECIAVRIPQAYFQNGGSASREPHPGDSAVLIFDASCEKLAGVQPVPLASTHSDGTTQIDGQKVFFQKRKGETIGNRGGGRKISADVSEVRSDLFEFYAPTPQGYAIVGGDSGGAILNEKGQLICPISGSSYEFKRHTGQLKRPRTSENSILDPFTVVCDKRAISRAREELKRFGMNLDPSQKIKVAGGGGAGNSCEATDDGQKKEEEKTPTVSAPSSPVFKALPGLR